MSVSTRTRSSQVPTTDKSLLGKRAVDSAPPKKVTKARATVELLTESYVKEQAKKDSFRKVKAGAIPQRCNFETLCKTNFMEAYRWLIAMQRMMIDAKKGANTDWWNICSVHGGGFNESLAPELQPLSKNYLRDYGPEVRNDWDTDPSGVPVLWNKMGFCAHRIPTFLVWHRVYMKSFELILQKYDPAPEQAKKGNPLQAHYWMWDAATCKALPDWCNTKEVLDIFAGGAPSTWKLVPNPLYQGISNEPDREYTIRGIPNADLNSPFAGLPAADLNQAYMSMRTDDYSQVSNQNNDGGLYSFEEPHNHLHNSVGGANATDTMEGDMADVQNSTFDPIFWLHHANIERFHFAWLHTHPVPTQIVMNKTDPKTGHTTHLDMTHTPLWPFPSAKNLSYDNMPWKTGKGGVNLVPSYAHEWWDNATLDYGYDNVTDIGVYDPPKPVPKGSQRVRVVLRDIYTRGSGMLHAKVNIGGKEFQLAPRALFSAKSSAPCANCDARRLTLAWEVDVPKTLLLATSTSSLTPATKVKSAVAAAGGKGLVKSAAAPGAPVFAPTAAAVTLVSLKLGSKNVDTSNEELSAAIE